MTVFRGFCKLNCSFIGIVVVKSCINLWKRLPVIVWNINCFICCLWLFVGRFNRKVFTFFERAVSCKIKFRVARSTRKVESLDERISPLTFWGIIKSIIGTVWIVNTEVACLFFALAVEDYIFIGWINIHIVVIAVRRCLAHCNARPLCVGVSIGYPRICISFLIGIAVIKIDTAETACNSLFGKSKINPGRKLNFCCTEWCSGFKNSRRNFVYSTRFENRAVILSKTICNRRKIFPFLILGQVNINLLSRRCCRKYIKRHTRHGTYRKHDGKCKHKGKAFLYGSAKLFT